MPSNRKAVRAILQQIPKGFEGKIYDLGSGWGTLAWSCARHCPKAEVIGFEISPIPWLVSKFFCVKIYVL